MKIIIGIYLIVLVGCTMEAYFCTKEIEDEDENSECCGARYISETDLCSKCNEHTGREI